MHVLNRWQGSTGSAGSGTCIRLEEDYGELLILTCAHLFTERGDPNGRQLLGPIEVKFPHEQRPLAGRLVYVDRDNDLALVACDGSPGLPGTALATAAPAAGETLWHVGYPLGRGPRTQSGRCVRASDGLTQMAARFQSGDSGGGIFNARGELVGVVSGFYTHQPDIGNGAHLVQIRRFVTICLPCLRGGPRAQRPAPTAPPMPRAEAPPIGSAGSQGPPGPPGRDADVSAVLAELKQLRGQLEELRAIRSQAGPAGPAGKDGERGPAGPPGPPGKDADIAQLRAEIADVRQQLRDFMASLRVRVVPTGQ